MLVLFVFVDYNMMPTSCSILAPFLVYIHKWLMTMIGLYMCDMSSFFPNKSAQIWWCGHFLMKWPFHNEVVISWWSGHFLMKFLIHQKRDTSSSSTWWDVENVPETLNSSKKWLHQKCHFLMKWPFLDEVAISWWSGHFLMKFYL